MRKQHQISIHNSRRLPAPKVQVYKRVFTPPLAAVQQVFVIFGFPPRNQPLKLDHIHTSFVVSCSYYTIFLLFDNPFQPEFRALISMRLAGVRIARPAQKYFGFALDFGEYAE